MFCDQLVATAEVAGEVPADPVGAGHQQIHEVVDHDRDLRPINRLKPDWPTRFVSHDPLTLQSSCCVRSRRASRSRGSRLNVTDHSMPSLERGSRAKRCCKLSRATSCDLTSPTRTTD